MLEFFDVYLSGFRVQQAPPMKTVDEKQESIPIPMDAKLITLAQYDRMSKSVITAHNLAEYRKKRFSLMLLPEIDIWFDRLIEGVKLTR